MSTAAPNRKRSFYKVSGGGNDFIAFPDGTGAAAPTSPVPTAEQIRAWCRRGLSLGADGIFVLRPGTSSVVMEHFNADGSASDLCLNGTRCAARLAFELGWAEERVVIVTGAGQVVARDAGRAGIELELPLPKEAPREIIATVQTGEHAALEISGTLLTVGVPHLILDQPKGLAAATVESLGKALVHHPAVGPAGANIDFVHWPTPDRLEIRTYERGVYGETLACGTGVMAAVAARLHARRARLPQCQLPVTALTRGGFELRVAGEEDPAASPFPLKSWSLTGDARLVARGELLPGALALPDEPVWS
ncbi:MAG: diaminopimelate epimerase [Acidobacteriota bacterium]|nr:diaminopimelate epimerase [Acidobacteriota bacterium]